MRIFWLDRNRLDRSIRKAVRELARQEPGVEEVVLFGSAAEGRALPSSDVDLLIVVSQADEPFLHRPARFAGHFRKVGLAVDLFVYTREELRQADIPLARSALRRGVVLFARRPATR